MNSRHMSGHVYDEGHGVPRWSQQVGKSVPQLESVDIPL